MTREQWIEACAARFVERAKIEVDTPMDAATAKDIAESCAGGEENLNGPDVTKWAEPVESADEEMSYWTDDE